MSPARTSAGPRLSRRSVTASSDVHRSTRSLRFRMMSVTSSFTPLMTSNSCSASSKRTCVTEARFERRDGEALQVALGLAGLDLGTLDNQHEKPSASGGGGLLGVELDD